jgi:pimeloyl-ACP methyl ester carboxylesterase
MSHAAWNAVTPYLCPMRRVIAFDIARFGSTPPLPDGTLPTIANLVDGLARSLREVGIETPIDLAGNSLGGARWVKKRGWGHVPMWIDPVGVSQLVLEGTR